MRAHGDEYMYVDADLDAPPPGAPAATAASKRGVGSLGFTGAVPKAGGVRPEGLIAVAGGFGTGPSEPMLPQTWGSDPSEVPGQAEEGDE